MKTFEKKFLYTRNESASWPFDAVVGTRPNRARVHSSQWKMAVCVWIDGFGFPAGIFPLFFTSMRPPALRRDHIERSVGYGDKFISNASHVQRQHDTVLFDRARGAREKKKKNEKKININLKSNIMVRVHHCYHYSRFGCGTEITVWSVQRLNGVFFPRK